MVSLQARVLLYCHNVWGLGHIVRSFRVATALLADGAEVTVVTGCRFLDAVEIPPGVRLERLPPVTIGGDGRLRPVEPSGITGPELLRERARRLEALCRDVEPHAVVVDLHPFGLGGELVPLLNAAAEERWTTRFFWGLPYRELDASRPRAPANPRLAKALGRYDVALVYGSRSWIDVAAAYERFGLPPRVEHVGFVVGEVPDTAPADPPLVAVVPGGGTKGLAVWRLALEALRPRLGAAEVGARFVVGPFGDPAAARGAAGSLPGIEVIDVGTTEEAIADAAVAICRCGYNSAYTAVASRLPVILVPRHDTGDEQRARASRLAELDRVWSVDAEALEDAGPAFASALDAALAAGRSERALPFPVDGAATAARKILEIAA